MVVGERSVRNLWSDLIGKRVMLVRCTDSYTTLEPGAEGKVELVDDTGTVFVRWDNGSRLGLIPGEDIWKVLT